MTTPTEQMTLPELRTFRDRMHQLIELKPWVTLRDALREIEHWEDPDLVDARRGLMIADETLDQQAIFALETPAIRDFIDEDKKINAIKEMRAYTGLGLKDAKEAVEYAVEMLRRGYLSQDERKKLDDEVKAATESILGSSRQ